jgi:hypothetical protein
VTKKSVRSPESLVALTDAVSGNRRAANAVLNGMTMVVGRLRALTSTKHDFTECSVLETSLPGKIDEPRNAYKSPNVRGDNGQSCAATA